MRESLSIRAYRPVINTHEHDFYQIVVPLHGIIEINVNESYGEVGVGLAVIVQKGARHSFKAMENSRFLVADLYTLPGNTDSLTSPFAAISNAMQAYCNFIEVQLQHQTNSELEIGMLEIFKQLLAVQDFLPRIDNRISRVQAYIESNLDAPCALDELAHQANLGVSHFKTEFKRQTGQSSGQYLLERRMEKARALLMNTDLPVGLIAEKVGYTSQSAFARRFSAYFGQSPRRFIISK